MLTVSTIAQARAIFAALPRPLGFVPTMGALHEGHLALVAAARESCASAGVSIFVNPLQFGQNEDLARYPRDLDRDARRLAEAGIDVLFAPDAGEMYPAGFGTYVDVPRLGEIFEGAIRPSHFRGVATVVTKLLHVVRPDVLFLGRKDAQQTVVVRAMVRDLAIAVNVQVVETMREDDGLAMSSRNAYLTTEQRAQAPTLQRALLALRDALQSGTRKPDAVVIARRALGPLARPDYLDVVDALTFEPVDRLDGDAYVIGAARFGNTRLIDNVHVPGAQVGLRG